MNTDREARYGSIAGEGELQNLLTTLNGWKLSESGKLSKKFSFKNFNDGLDFVNRVAKIADRLDHHPDVYLNWSEVELSIFTHCKGELTKTDFELAREIDLI